MVGKLAWGIAFAALVGCGGGGGQGSDAGAQGDGAITQSCDPDPLKTGLVAQQTGVSVDAFDCSVVTWSAHYAEPDPMIFKAIMYVESRFDHTSVSCPNNPCGTPNGWSSSETGCFGLMQIVPACGGMPNDAGLLPNGHPDLDTDTSSSDWASSVFNPDVNIEIGIAGVAGNRAQEKAKFSGCTEDQYTMMALGDYNDYGSTKSCTDINTKYRDLILPPYQQYAAAAGYTAHPY